MKTVIDALRRERREYKFAPVWLDEQEVPQAAAEAEDQHEQEVRKEEERQRALHERAEREEQRKHDKQQQNTQVEEEFRRKNGVRARALSDQIGTVIKRRMEEVKPDQLARSGGQVGNASDDSSSAEQKFTNLFQWLR